MFGRVRFRIQFVNSSLTSGSLLLAVDVPLLPAAGGVGPGDHEGQDRALKVREPRDGQVPDVRAKVKGRRRLVQVVGKGHVHRKAEDGGQQGEDGGGHGEG